MKTRIIILKGKLSPHQFLFPLYISLGKITVHDTSGYWLICPGEIVPGYIFISFLQIQNIHYDYALIVTVRLKIITNQFMIFKEKFTTCRYHVKDGKIVRKILVSD